MRGIWLSGVTLNSGSGNIALRGQGWLGSSSTGEYSIGVDLVIGTTIQSTSGSISIVGRGGINYDVYTHGVGINIYTNGTANNIFSTTGDITLNGAAGSGTARTYAGINQDGGVASVYSTSGNVTLIGSGSGANDKGINGISGTTFNIGTNVGNSIVTNGNILLQANSINIAGAMNFKNTGTLTVEPISTSFTAAISWPLTNLTILGTNGLTIGKSGNTANITIGTTQSINGPITIYAGTLTLTGGLTTTNTTTGNISLVTSALTGSNITVATGRSLTINQSGNSSY
ncbi:MAG: hypothetical protein RL233_1850, partial [Bacteroidota bacterium]